MMYNSICILVTNIVLAFECNAGPRSVFSSEMKMQPVSEHPTPIGQLPPKTAPNTPSQISEDTPNPSHNKVLSNNEAQYTIIQIHSSEE